MPELPREVQRITISEKINKLQKYLITFLKFQLPEDLDKFGEMFKKLSENCGEHSAKFRRKLRALIEYPKLMEQFERIRLKPEIV